jgi:hypothetical protein
MVDADMKKIKDQSILAGDEQLIPKSDWIEFSEMNRESLILNDKHGIFNDAFQKILEKHTMNSKILFLSGCTTTRPYNLSKKWKFFIERFGVADFVVSSNGGIIPQKYFSSFPYLNYNGETTIVGTPLFQSVLKDRVEKFLNAHPYDYVLANFRPKLRSTPVVKEVLADLKENGTIKDYAVIPDGKLYEKARIDGFIGPNGNGAMFPDLHQFILDAMGLKLKEWSNLLNGVPDIPSP